MTIALPEEVSVSLHRNGFVDYDLTAYLLSCLDPGATVLDVGAHIGYYTMLTSALVGATGKVVAFEPTPSTLSVLRLNAARRPNVKVEECAAWSTPTQLSFHDHGLGYSAYNSAFDARLPAVVRNRVPTNSIRVRAVSLDNYVRENALNPDFIKIDAESAELQVLTGLAGVLADHHPLLSLEVGDLDVADAPTSRELVDHLVAVGYRPWEIHRGELTPHVPQHTYQYQNLIFTPPQYEEG